MLTVVTALVPVFLVIATGWGMRISGIVSDDQWIGFERLTYYLFFPAIIVLTLVKADLRTVPVVAVGTALIGAILTVSATLVIARRAFERTIRLDGPSFTSLFQGSTRWNTFVALALAGNLHGTDGLTIMAIAIAAMIPLLNVLAILVLVRYAGGPPQSPMEIARTMARNPFIWSCAVGIALNALSPPIPRIMLDYADILGRASLGAGLLVVGSGLDLSRLARPRIVHWLALVVKLMVMPLLVALYATGLRVTGAGWSVALIAASVPTSTAAYILARQLGGNAPLMAEIVTLQTLAAMLSMPVLLAVLG